MRLLTLWFDYGQWPEVYDAIVEGIRSIEIDTWLQVTLLPVSYTHLDVYKRQGVRSPQRKTFWRVVEGFRGVIAVEWKSKRLHMLISCLLYTSRCV